MSGAPSRTHSSVPVCAQQSGALSRTQSLGEPARRCRVLVAGSCLQLCSVCPASLTPEAVPGSLYTSPLGAGGFAGSGSSNTLTSSSGNSMRESQFLQSGLIVVCYRHPRDCTGHVFSTGYVSFGFGCETNGITSYRVRAGWHFWIAGVAVHLRRTLFVSLSSYDGCATDGCGKSCLGAAPGAHIPC